MTNERLATALAGRYRIERELGQGGMATVYLAHDLKHDRKVALKVLKPELAAVLGAERFVVEIKTTAALQHPHILPLFDSGTAEGFLYYVMPYIQGETLRDKLSRETQLGIDEAVKIAREVADALDYAHRHGVIHRDIKPENILLHDGRPMVADFGIALALSAAAGGRMTETGMSLGTPHYMSPEQATADKEITGRSDIYSLASVLYEMLTGEPPHMGNSAQQIIMKIVAEPAQPVTRLRKSVPANVTAAVAKALEKLSADRFASAAQFAAALGDPSFRTGDGTAAGVGAASPTKSRRTVVALAALAVVLLAAAAWGWLRPPATRPVTRYQITLSDSVSLNGYTLMAQAALAPDGSTIVYRDSRGGRTQLYAKRRDALEPQALAGSEGGYAPFFSPDGAWIGFFVRGQLRKMPTSGGGAVALADTANGSGLAFGAWLDDGTIVFNDRNFAMRQVPASGGPARALRGPRTGTTAGLLFSPLPGGRGLLFTGCSANCVESAAYVFDAKADSSRILVPEALGIWYSPTGHALYLTRAGTLLAAPWDAGRLAFAGPAVPILDGLQPPGFALAPDGSALYVLGPPIFQSGPAASAEAVWVDRSGRMEPVDTTWRFNTGGTNWGLALSPDGRRLAIRLATALGPDIWIKQLPAGPLSRLTFFEGEDHGPRWSPDGRKILYLSGRPLPGDTTPLPPDELNLWSQLADGTGAAELLWNDAKSITEAVVSPDGGSLVLRTTGTSGLRGDRDILLARPGADSGSRPLVATSAEEQAPALSPDGRWIAYLSTETGAYEVFIRPFPEVDRGKWQVSNGGGNAPLWSHSGREIFYLRGGNLMAVDIHPGPPFSVGTPRALFARPQSVRGGSTVGGYFDIAPDDQRFLMVRNVSLGTARGAATLVLVQNFFEEIRARTRK